MVVQHNLTAMNSNRMLGITTSKQAKATEKLSSGYKINRAADDAAGLSISEKMRKQIRGLTQASSNAQDGISAVQTAEGALTEVHDMLQRMNELAVKASNGTNSESDRQSIQDEIDQLVTEIDRVSETTKFNETYLLKGNAEGTESSVKVNAHDAGIAGKLVDNGNSATFTVDSELELGDKISIAGQDYTIGTDGAGKTGTDGYKKTDDSGLLATAVDVGDSVKDASSGITYTIVNKVANVAALFVDDKTSFTVTHADGTTMDYAVGAAGAGKISEEDALDLVKQELAAGSKVNLKTDANGAACDAEIVSALQTTGVNQEISIAATNLSTNGKTVEQLLADASVTAAAGDQITVGGETTTLTANEPKAASDVTELISALEKNDAVKVTRNGGTAVTYTIAEETDAVNNKYTAADLADLIKDGDQLAFQIATTNTKGTLVATTKGITPGTTSMGTTEYTLVGNGKSENSDTISKAKALQMIADELQKASSVGTDEAATVKNNNDGSFVIEKGSVTVKDDLNFSLQVGADADLTNKINVNIGSVNAAGLGVKGINVKDSTGTSAKYAIDAIADAVAKVSAQRSALGAVQNRLEHTINNLDNVVENTTSAESQIRDTDMATQMVEYSKNNILAQAGQSMLAQANQSNQGVLSLLG